MVLTLKTLSNTDVVASRHNKKTASLPITLHRSKTLCLIYNWGEQQNLVLCEKALPSDCYIQVELLMTFFGSALGSSRRRPTLPQQCCGQKSSHFHPWCSKFIFVRGGRGGVATFTNNNEKVPTLLTSIVLSKIFMQIEKKKYKKNRKKNRKSRPFFFLKFYLNEIYFWDPCSIWLPVFHNMQRKVARNSSDYFESFSPLNNVWIDRPLMPSSDVTHNPTDGTNGRSIQTLLRE